MRLTKTAAMLSFAMLFFLGIGQSWSAQERGTQPSDVLSLTGNVTNVQGKGVKDVKVSVFVDGKEVHLADELVTHDGGSFHCKVALPGGTLPSGKVEAGFSKTAYKTSDRVILDHVLLDRKDGKGNAYYVKQVEHVLQRAISPTFWLASLILLGVYVVIAFELLHRTLAALMGAAMILTISYTVGTFYPEYHILSFEDAAAAIDINVIWLLMAMMIIVGVMKKTGVFQWLALKCFEVSKGNIYALSAVLMFITGATSAFLDNVTTMLLMTPVTIEISKALRLNPLSLMLPEAFASNVGGTATIIGDPPNVMIGSYAKLTFMDFVDNLAVICLIGLAVSILYYIWYFKKDYKKAVVGDVAEMTKTLREEYKITDPRLLTISLIVLGLTVLLFVFHGPLHMEVSVAALMGAGVLLVLSRVDIVQMLEKEIEWPTLIFFMMLFIVVAGAEESGLIQVIADWVRDMSGGSLVVAVALILWVSAIASAFIDNIPFTATMLPLVASLNQTMPGAESGILWWALALGACLGGNGTMIGASANIVTVGIAESLGYPVSFMQYMKIAWWPMMITVALSTGWLIFVMM